MNEIAVKYQDERGEEVKLTTSDVVKYISTDSSVTEKEVVVFLKVCKYLRLNPFLKEIYLVKYRGAPAQIVVSYHTLLKRIEKNPNFDGYETTVTGEVPNLTATATVYRKDRKYPVKVTVKYSEAAKTVIDKRTGKERPMSMWRNMPEWMLRKTALARALKEAFPNAVGGASVNTEEAVDIDSKDKHFDDIKKEPAQKAIDDLYGVSDEEQRERKYRKDIYELLEEKKINTIAKVTDLLNKALPYKDWTGKVDKTVFEKMKDDDLEQVLDYLNK